MIHEIKHQLDYSHRLALVLFFVVLCATIHALPGKIYIFIKIKSKIGLALDSVHPWYKPDTNGTWVRMTG
jgi:hypothetical protein